MLTSIIKSAVSRVVGGRSRKREKEKLLNAIKIAHQKKDWRKAIEWERAYLRLEPKEIGILVSLGIHLAEVGEKRESSLQFELAHQLDDSNMEVAVHYARCQIDEGRTQEALANLVRAQVVIPGYPHVSSNFASLQFRIGDIEKARIFALRAWLAEFDSERLPDSFLWHSAYADQPDEVLSAEHHFWAETCPPTSQKLKQNWPAIAPNSSRGKLRIGYWSPDFRDHSVRYFFRPLLEGHDRDRVEIMLFHDVSASDQQTDEIRARCDHFFPVYEKSDEELVAFIVSKDLDILVELAGHTSHNRLWLLQGRLARVQITGLGYPPTTGLESVDGKLVDPILSTPADARFYSEKPVVLPSSFWCFDPRGDAVDPAEPPVLKNGYVTFGCFGNAAKINLKMMACWAEIMRRVPRSRLVLRALNFENPEAVNYYSQRLRQAGIDPDRMALLGPVSNKDFFRSYEHLDIVLDTHPFNGGTTTCFATYMGVPVVTLAGVSLISRMGASVVSNAGAPELAVHTADAYVSKAVSLSQDISFLKRYRKDARIRMAAGSLGDGKKFARDFENACETLLDANSRPDAVPYKCAIQPLAAEELVRRAAVVLGFNQWAASRRILAYCLRNYSDFAGAHILMTEELTKDGKFSEAANYLAERVSKFAPLDLPAVYINIIRFLLMAEDEAAAVRALEQLELLSNADQEERAQCSLYRALMQSRTAEKGRVPSPIAETIHCLLVCDEDLFSKRVAALETLCGKSDSIKYIRCSEEFRISDYQAALAQDDAGVIVLMQKNVVIKNPAFFQEIVKGLEDADVLGYSGARRWDRLDWRLDEPAQRCGAFSTPSAEKPGFAELRIVGDGTQSIATGMAILEGDLLAIRTGVITGVPFSEDLLGAGTLLEEAWSYSVGRSGARLAVNRGLGVHIDRAILLKSTYLLHARLALVEQMQFDVFSVGRQDGTYLYTPCANADESFRALDRYLSLD